MRVLRHITANDEILSPFPFPRELSMESYLVENASVLTLSNDENDEFSDVTIVSEELTLKEGRQLSDGRIDLLISYGENYAGVVELKKGELGQKHLDQLEDYLSGANIEKLRDQFPSDVQEDIKWIGVLVGSSIEKGLQEKISGGYRFGDIPIAALTINRFKSVREIFVATDVYFQHNVNSKDWSKYEFNGEKFGKGKLVLNVMQHYIAEHPNIDFSELKRVFPDKLRGTGLGVFDTLEKAEEIFDKWKYKRHFIKPNEVISLQDVNIAVCSQWGIGNIEGFIKKAKELGFAIKKVEN